MAEPTVAVNDREHRKRHPLVCDLGSPEHWGKRITVVSVNGREYTGELVHAKGAYYTPYIVHVAIQTDPKSITYINLATGTDTPDGRVAYECIDHSVTIIHDTL